MKLLFLIIKKNLTQAGYDYSESDDYVGVLCPLMFYIFIKK